MENIIEFNNWLHKMLEDAERKLGMTDETIAYILLQEGIGYFLKTIAQRKQDG